MMTTATGDKNETVTLRNKDPILRDVGYEAIGFIGPPAKAGRRTTNLLTLFQLNPLLLRTDALAGTNGTR